MTPRDYLIALASMVVLGLTKPAIAFIMLCHAVNPFYCLAVGLVTLAIYGYDRIEGNFGGVRLKVLLLACGILSVAITASLNRTAVLGVILALAIGAAYANYLKPITWLKNAVIAGSWAATAGWAPAIIANASIESTIIITGFIFSITWINCTFCDIGDIDSDATKGICTLPMILGNTTQTALAFFASASWFLGALVLNSWVVALPVFYHIITLVHYTAKPGPLAKLAIDASWPICFILIASAYFVSAGVVL